MNEASSQQTWFGLWVCIILRLGRVLWVNLHVLTPITLGLATKQLKRTLRHFCDKHTATADNSFTCAEWSVLAVTITLICPSEPHAAKFFDLHLQHLWILNISSLHADTGVDTGDPSTMTTISILAILCEMEQRWASSLSIFFVYLFQRREPMEINGTGYVQTGCLPHTQSTVSKLCRNSKHQQ